MKVVLDLNVLLDVYLNRAPWVTDAAAVMQANYHQQITGCVSADSATTLFYIVRRNAGIPAALTAVDACLGSFLVLPLQRSTLEVARQQTGSDFEDNVVIATAIENTMDAIVTRDASGFVASPIPVLTPAVLAARLTKPTP